MQNYLKQVSIEQSLEILNNQGIILYPTDTVWGIGCDATSTQAIQKIFKLKKRNETKSFIILVSDFKMLTKYISFPNEKLSETIFNWLENTKKPTSVIYENPKNLPNKIISADNTIAIRLVKDDFCKELIQKFGKPIVSTSANISGEATPQNFSDIHSEIIQGVDFVVPYKQNISEKAEPSQLVRLLKTGEIVVLRK